MAEEIKEILDEYYKYVMDKLDRLIAYIDSRKGRVRALESKIK